MKKNRNIWIVCFCLWSSFSINGQDLLDQLESSYIDTPQYEIATFKTSRIAMGHAVKTLKKGVLEIGARNLFWNIPNKQSQSFVADRMSTRLSLEYGVSNTLTFGLGATTLDGIFDGFIKYRWITQSKQVFPLSIAVFQNASYRSKRDVVTDVHIHENFGDKLAFTTQLLIARKVTTQFSVQLSPTFIHRTSSRFDEDPQNHLALGIGGRYKLGGHVSLVSEYYQVLNTLESSDTHNAFSLGVNWELSDVMLQFRMTNTRNLVEDAFITQTPNNFNLQDGNFVFGFTGIFILHLHNPLKSKQ